MKLTHPSPAMVVAVAALVVSLGGSATAASVLITSSAQIGSGSITSSDIRNGAIKRRDLTAGLRPLRGSRGPVGAPGPAGPAGVDASPSAVSVSQLAGAASTLNDAAWDDIVALTQTITVPAGRPRQLLATVSGESECSTADTELGNFCMLRIVIDGTQELLPREGDEFAFNSPDPDVGEEKGSWESLSIQRTSEVLAPGPHTVTVQHRVTTGQEPVRHRFDDAVLSVLQFETGP